MKTKLSQWELDAKKWREENGYITPEWMIYVKNRSNILITACVMSFIYGARTAFVAIQAL